MITNVNRKFEFEVILSAFHFRKGEDKDKEAEGLIMNPRVKPLAKA